VILPPVINHRLLVSSLIQRLGKISILNPYNIQTRIQELHSQAELQELILTDNSVADWRILVLLSPQKYVIVFQNHRQLCGGQERMWTIINQLLDSPQEPDGPEKQRLTKTSSNISNLLLPTLNTLSVMRDPFIPSERVNRNFKVKHFQLSFIQKICQQNHCSINDFAITWICYQLINQHTVRNSHINVFVPIFIEGYYCYHILRVKNIPIHFKKLLTVISKSTEQTVKNHSVKKISLYTTRIGSFLPQWCQDRIFQRVMDRVHLFVSNVRGFRNQRYLANYPVYHIYQMYHSYHRPIEAGISSYNGQLTITLNSVKNH
jgi:hypothetical protein